MKLLQNKVLLVIVLLLSAVLCFSFTKKAPSGAEVQWMTFEQMQEAQKKQPRKVIVDVYTDWCGWCKKMDKTTFEHPVIADYLNKNYYVVKFNAESKQPVTFAGKVYQNNARYHDLANVLMNNKMGFPTSIYLDENLTMITQPIASYLDAKQFEVIIAYLSEEKYKTTPFDEYQASFKSKIVE